LIDSSTLHPKIGGFSESCFWSSQIPLDGMIGSNHYLAPEMDPSSIWYQKNKECTKAADVYSFGLILYEMIVGQPVFGFDTPHDELISFSSGPTRPELPRTMAIGMRQILRQCLSADPELRNSFDVIWRQLEDIEFDITPGADRERIRNYIREIT
jgi:serine/threonine protein kinase